MRKIIFLLANICIIIFLMLPLLSASLQTELITPQTINLCGDYAQYTTLQVSALTNLENTTLTTISATLYVVGTSGLSFVTPQSVNIGSIDALSNATILPSWTLQCNTPQAGTYIAYINYTSSNGYSASSFGQATSSLIVHDTTPITANISITEGESSSNEELEVILDNTPTIYVTTNKDAICKGSLDQDESYDNMDFIFYGTSQSHNYTFVEEISEGEHTVYARCKNTADEETQVIELSFFIDSKAPDITVTEPLGKVVGAYTTLSIELNEEAECRYLDEDDSFDDMETFDTVTSTLYSVELVSLQEGTYEYYITCKDDIGNKNTHILEFEVQLPPTVNIILEQTPPLSKGTYEVTVIPSKKLRSVPTLLYRFTDDDDFERSISLVKDGGVYTGYIIIDDEIKTRSGIFSFEGFDLQGNKGTEITNGAAFLVDTKAPIAPETVEISSNNQGISIEWYYGGERSQYYNVYRSTSSGVGHIDYYETVQGSEILDTSVSKDQLYFYRIAAVDIAGNIGTLSKEVSTYATVGSEQSNDDTNSDIVINKNPPTEETKEWKENTESALDTLLIDLENALKSIQDQEKENKDVLVLSLSSSVQGSLSEIQKTKNEISSIDILSVENNNLRERLSKIDALIARTKKTAPSSFEILKTTTQKQPTTDSDVEVAIDEFFARGGANYTERQERIYFSKMRDINEKLSVQHIITTLKVTSLDNTELNKVIIKKEFFYDSPDELSNVVIIEIIPKTVAGDVSAIDFKTPGHSVVNPDPVVQWNFATLNTEQQSHTYVINSDDTSESAKTTRTIVLLDPLDVIGEDNNLITGFSISLDSLPGFEFIGITLGIITILGLGMYYFVVVQEVDISIITQTPSSVKNHVQDRIGRLRSTSDTYSNQSSSYLQTLGKSDASVTQQSTNYTNQSNEVQISNTYQMPQQAQYSNSQNTSQISNSGLQSTALLPTQDYSTLFMYDDPMKTIPAQYFHTQNGDVIRSLSEMIDVLEEMDDFTFYYHVNDTQHDFADWVATIYHQVELSQLMRQATRKHQLLSFLKSISGRGTL